SRTRSRAPRHTGQSRTGMSPRSTTWGSMGTNVRQPGHLMSGSPSYPICPRFDRDERDSCSPVGTRADGPRVATVPEAADLLAAPLEELLHEAAAVRDAATGPRVTYSPKVFIPLTQ